MRSELEEEVIFIYIKICKAKSFIDGKIHNSDVQITRNTRNLPELSNWPGARHLGIF
jgi:hypothetical protein